ncbi:MAG TPA: FecR family protein [Mariniphaga anaerophila]|uniref:FecR family protein n=1 Tax=Mariniphaga anaerophila TaxID=1484053 RepID=A0A831LTN7_9BACT|nr:FecR family protein [Mariniphaga anaerophila]
MEKNKTYKTLEKFSGGKYSWNEYQLVKSWFEHIHNFNEAKSFLKEHWNNLSDSDSPDVKSLDHIYRQIEYHILLEEKKESKKTNLWRIYRQAAAILLIPVLVFSAWYFFSEKTTTDTDLAWVEIQAPHSSRIQFALPDGSSGWLNSGSSLSYNPQFTKKRQVQLSGEAYFEVKPSDIFFNVKTSDFDVNVLGTTFNVTAYEDDSFSQVVLVEGKVNVAGYNQLLDRTLSPGERLFVYPAENKFNVSKVDTESLTAWKDGLLLLDNEPLELAVKRMERWYNVEIIVEDELLKRYRFKATFEDEPLEEVLKLLSVSTPMEYTFEKREENSDGIYKKKRVRIKLKQL